MDHLLRSAQDYPGFWALHALALLTEAVCVFWMLRRSRREREQRKAWERSVEDLRYQVIVLNSTSQQKPAPAYRGSAAGPMQSTGKDRSAVQSRTVGQREGRGGSEYVDLPPSLSQLGQDVESQFEGGRPASRPQPVSYYAAVPEADGSFKESQLRREPQYDSLYRLDVALDGQAASLSLHRNPEGFRAAVESPRRYLDPACSYKESTLSGTSTPVESRPGLAVLDDARWRVQQKIQVEFQ